MAELIENGRARNPLTLCSVPALVHVQVLVHIPGNPQSVHLRNASTTSFFLFFVMSVHTILIDKIVIMFDNDKTVNSPTTVTICIHTRKCICTSIHSINTHALYAIKIIIIILIIIIMIIIIIDSFYKAQFPQNEV